jgi:hypothetical protein
MVSVGEPADGSLPRFTDKGRVGLGGLLAPLACMFFITIYVHHNGLHAAR